MIVAYEAKFLLPVDQLIKPKAWNLLIAWGERLNPQCSINISNTCAFPDGLKKHVVVPKIVVQKKVQ